MSSENVYAATVYEFIATDHPHAAEPQLDLDLASFGVTKVVRADYQDAASPYRWPPKQAFHALARHNASRRSHR